MREETNRAVAHLKSETWSKTRLDDCAWDQDRNEVDETQGHLKREKRMAKERTTGVQGLSDRSLVAQSWYSTELEEGREEKDKVVCRSDPLT